MSADQLEGMAKQGVGHVQDAVGGLVGDDGAQLKGKVNEAIGTAQQTYGQVKERAQQTLDQASVRAQDALDDAQVYLSDRPLVGVAIGAGLGLLLGLTLRGGRKTVYLTR